MANDDRDGWSQYQLYRIAQARSGDKGDTCDISLFAPDDETYAIFRDAVTPASVKAHFGDFVRGEVERYELPNLQALKFVCHGALGGGGAGSLRSDNLGKSMAANLLRMTVSLPDELAQRSPIFSGPGGVS